MKAANPKRIDQFLLMHSSRADQWRGITVHAEDWLQGRSSRPALEAAVEAVAPVEGFHAYPGPALFAALRDRIAADDAAGALRLARRISNALLTRAYRQRPGEWDAAEDTGSEVIDVLPPTTGERRAQRPYFEVLFVNNQPAARWPALAAELRRLRRPEDAFVYEPVIRRFSSRTRSAPPRSTRPSPPWSSPRASPTAPVTTRRSYARCSTRWARPTVTTPRRCAWPRR